MATGPMLLATHEQPHAHSHVCQCALTCTCTHVHTLTHMDTHIHRSWPQLITLKTQKLIGRCITSCCQAPPAPACAACPTTAPLHNPALHPTHLLRSTLNPVTLATRFSYTFHSLMVLSFVEMMCFVLLLLRTHRTLLIFSSISKLFR